MKSCGCLKIINTKKSNSTHGQSDTPLYYVWKTMRSRCGNVSSDKYYRYGARGIKVCEEWQDFINFRDWALSNGYSDGLTIDRIDNDGNYEPNNCQWVSNKVQARNKSTNRIIEYKGRKRILSEWAKITGMKRELIAYRLNKGWSPEKTFNTPVRKQSKLSKGVN